MWRRTDFLVLAAAAAFMTLSNAAFVPSNNGACRARNLCRFMAAPTKDEILAAYQQKIGVKTAASASKAAASSSTITAPTESLPDGVPTEAALPPVVVVETPPPPPLVEAVQTPLQVMEQVEQVTTAAPDTTAAAGSDPISSLWNQVTSPFRDVDPFEKIKIPADFKNVDLKASVPDFKSISMPDFKSITVPDFKSMDFTNIQFPTPPARPEAPGVILPDGARMKTLFDIFGKPDVSQWKLSSSFSLPSLLEALRVSEFGAWYLAGLLLVAWQIQAQTTQELYEEKLHEAEQKARQAAEAASLAAEGATLTKQLATSGPPNKMTKPLKSTETILSESQQEALRLEKEEMKKKVEMLQHETQALKRQLQAATTSADHNVVNGANASPSVPKVQPKIVQPIDAETNAQVLEIIKQQDEANAAKAATKPVPKKTAKKKAEPKKKSVTKAAPKKERVTARKEANVAVMEPIVKVEEAIAVEPIASGGEVFFANVTVAEEETKSSKVAAKKTTPKKKVDAKKTVEAAPETTDHPWKALTPSTLKRKTVKDLSAYLSERDVQVTDEAGKPLKKAELLDKVMAL